MHALRPAADPLQVGIVNDDRDVVCGELHVELDMRSPSSTAEPSAASVFSGNSAALPR